MQVVHDRTDGSIIAGKRSNIHQPRLTHRPRRASVASAASRSSGRVIFRLLGDDSTIITRPPAFSRNAASSVADQSSATARLYARSVQVPERPVGLGVPKSRAIGGSRHHPLCVHTLQRVHSLKASHGTHAAGRYFDASGNHDGRDEWGARRRAQRSRPSWGARPGDPPRPSLSDSDLRRPPQSSRRIPPAQSGGSAARSGGSATTTASTPVNSRNRRRALRRMGSPASSRNCLGAPMRRPSPAAGTTTPTVGISRFNRTPFSESPLTKPRSCRLSPWDQPPRNRSVCTPCGSRD